MFRHCPRRPMAALMVSILMAAAPAAAEEGAAPPASTGRYAFVPAAEGTLRLDTQSGAVSLCAGTGAELSCRPVREEASRAREMRALEARLAALEARLAAIEARDEEAGEDTGEARGLPTLKDEEAVDRVMDLAERMMRRFFDMVEALRDEAETNRI